MTLPGTDARVPVLSFLVALALPVAPVAAQDAPCLGASGFADQEPRDAGPARAARVEREAARIAEAGIFWERTLEAMGGPFAWEWVERRRGKYDFELADERVRACAARGIRIVAMLHPNTPWDQPWPPSPTLEFPNDVEAYRNYVRSTVERYDGDGRDDMPGLPAGYGVRHWEVWNEPEFRLEGGAAGYVRLLRETREAILSADPEAIVLSGGAAPFWHMTPQGKLAGGEHLLRFWDEVLERGAGDAIDVFNVHDWVGPELRPVADTLRAWRELLARHGLERPIWITEFGSYEGDVRTGRTPDGNAWPSRTPEEQAATLVRRAAQAHAAGAGAIFLSQVAHLGRHHPRWLRKCDLLFDLETPKPAFWAVRRYAGLLSGAKSVRADGDSPGGERIEILSGESRIDLLWGAAGDEIELADLCGDTARILPAVPRTDDSGRTLVDSTGDALFADRDEPLRDGRLRVRLEALGDADPGQVLVFVVTSRE